MSNLLIAVQAADIMLLGTLFYVSVRRIGDWSTIAWAFVYGVALDRMFPGEGARQAKFITAFAVELLAATAFALEYTFKHHGPREEP